MYNIEQQSNILTLDVIYLFIIQLIYSKLFIH